MGSDKINTSDAASAVERLAQLPKIRIVSREAGLVLEKPRSFALPCNEEVVALVAEAFLRSIKKDAAEIR
jgi:hypothetical protein